MLEDEIEVGVVPNVSGQRENAMVRRNPLIEAITRDKCRGDRIAHILQLSYYRKCKKLNKYSARVGIRSSTWTGQATTRKSRQT
jgi:hypothetical protein